MNTRPNDLQGVKSLVTLTLCKEIHGRLGIKKLLVKQRGLPIAFKAFPLFPCQRISARRQIVKYTTASDNLFKNIMMKALIKSKTYSTLKKTKASGDL